MTLPPHNAVNFSRIVPNGLLVFFPSYPVMNGCVETWKVSSCLVFSDHKRCHKLSVMAVGVGEAGAA